MKAHLKTYRIFTPVIILACFCWVDAMAQPVSGLSVPAQQDTVTKKQAAILVDMLNSSFQSLADKERRGRMTGGYVLLGLGIGSGIGGAITLLAGKGDDARVVGYSLLGGGAFLSGLSLIPFKVKSETEHLYSDFREDIEEGVDEKHQNFYYWDHRFEELVHKKKRERIIGGISSIVGSGLASLFWIEGTDQDRLHAFIWPALGGVTRLLIKSDEERRYDSYRKAKEDIIGQSAQSKIRFGIVPLPESGIAVALQVLF